MEALLAEVRLIVKKFPLSNVKTFQYLHAVQLTVANMQQQLEDDRQRQVDQSETIKQLRLEIENLKKNRGVTSVEKLVVSPVVLKTPAEEKMDFNNTDCSGKNVSIESSSTITGSSVYSGKLQLSSASYSDLDRHSALNSVFHRMAAIEKKIDEVKKDQERAIQLERFVMHLHERIKSLDCGRNGRLVWKISGFSTIFNNAKVQETRKQKNQRFDSNSPCDFCSPLFYTAPQGYLMYMRLYPYGCDAAVGKHMSLFVALCPGEFDGVLPWPFTSAIEISILNQDDLCDKWSQTIIPGNNNLQCFQRPSSKSGNMSVGILHFILHKLVH